MSDLLSKPAPTQVSDVEPHIRRDLAACYRLIAQLGWDDLTANHISARLPVPGEVFLINPYGLFFEEVTASNLVKIDSEGAILEPTPYTVNRAGFVIHSAVHMARPDAGCVIHLHTNAGVAVSTLKEGLLPLSQMAMLILDDVAYHDYEGVAVDLDERVRLQRDLGDKNLMILRNHGTLAVGRTVGEAFRRIHLLEKACEIQVASLGMGRPLHFPAPEQDAKTRGFGPRAVATNAELAWPALLRRLDRTDPGYAD